MTGLASATWALAARSVRQYPRVPADFVVALLIPLFFFAVTSVTYASVARIPGFPTGDYALFFLPLVIVFAVFTSANGVGYALVLEVKNGYLDKLLALPIPRLAILLGRLLAVAARCMVQVALVLAIGYAFGMRFVTGLPGVAAVLLLAAGLAVAWASIGSFIALTTRSPEATEGMTILFLPLLYLTTGSMPLGLLPDGFRDIVVLNPVTYVIEGIRALLLDGWAAPAVATLPGLPLPAVPAAALAVVGFGAVTVTAATWALGRMDA
ncbi:MAG TPA: ABC transporter permease [Candidatus Thermoplasmatota archaeon]|nr:ABC transporter permease [Candidatus Thermoplasmatota archaeon]